MCGRFSQAADPEALRERFQLFDVSEYKRRYNVAPTQNVPVIVESDGKRKLEGMRWGLVPRWAKDPSVGSQMINARSESAAEKPSFREAFKARRCLVPADGFYEWKKAGRQSMPYRVVLKDRQLFALAGLWESWHTPGGTELLTFTILTTDANQKLSEFHDRMPVFLNREDESLWLAPYVTDTKTLQPLLKPYPDDKLDVYPVSAAVNSALVEGPDLILPSKAQQQELF